MSATRTAAVQTALTSGRFDVASIAPLEAFVLAQRSGAAEYDLEANLTLLSLYSLTPTRRSWAHCSDILLLAIAALPETDLLAVQLALPADAPEEIKTVQLLGSLLESGSFSKAWNLLEAQQSKWGAAHPNLLSNVRRFIVTLLQASYQTIKARTLAEALHVSVEELRQQSGASTWTFADDCVAFPLTEANQARPKKSADAVPFEQLSKVLISTQ